MVFVYIFAAIYGVVGFVYALYIMLNGIDPWYNFFINIVGGPIALIYSYIKYAVKKEIPR